MSDSMPSNKEYKTNQAFAKKVLWQFSNKNYSPKQKIKKYGKTPIIRNWNRLAELTKHWYKKDELEIRYRIDIQNYYVLFGKIPDHFIEP